MKRLTIILCLLAGCVLGDVSIINTFTSGELSPHLDARADFDKYSSGCRTLENFIVLPYGGAKKRSGTQYIEETKNGGVARLQSFSVGVDQTYVMELGAGYIRFYSDGIQITTSDVPVEVATPYTSNDLFEIQFAQFADTVYMVHGDHPVQKLQRTTTAPTFTIEEVVWGWPPVLDENLEDITIEPSATTGTITLTASDEIFTTNHVGSAWMIRSPYDNNSIEHTGNGASDSLRIEGDWNFRTSGGLEAGDSYSIEMSEDSGNTWGVFRKYEGRDPEPFVDYDRDGLETEYGILYRINGEGSPTAKAFLKNEEAYLNGWVTITSYLTATTVQARVESVLGSTNATDQWFEGAFSDERGHPRTVEFYENRLWFGGTDYLANTLWASKTDDYQNFQTGTYDDSSLRLSINSDNIIEWILGRTQLFIGTLGDEWVLSGGDSQTPISPTTVLARRQTGFGSRDGIDALVASDSIMYLQRQGRKLRELEYSLEADAYKSVDATLLAEHITDGVVVQIAEQQQPEPIVWCVKGNGDLVGMTFNKIQNIYGWHRHVTDGEFESVTVIPTEGEDRVYVVVNRENGRYVEWFTPMDWGDDEDAWFVDSGLDWDGGDSVTVTNMTLGTNLISVASTEGSVNKEYTYLEEFEGYSRWTNGEYQIYHSTNGADYGWNIRNGTNETYYHVESHETYPWNATFANTKLVSSGTSSPDLDGVIWRDTGSVTNGKKVYYDATSEYAYWNHPTDGMIVSAVADVGGSPTDYFKVIDYPLTIIVSGGGYSGYQGEYTYVENSGDFYYQMASCEIKKFGTFNYWVIYIDPITPAGTYSDDYIPPKDGWVAPPLYDPAPTLSYTIPTALQGFGSFSGVLTVTNASLDAPTLSPAPVMVWADNTFANSDHIRLSEPEGMTIRSFGEGVFIATNTSASSFELLYVNGGYAYADGTHTNTGTAEEVKKVFTNVSHLAGQTVNIFAEGGVQPDKTISAGGELELEFYYNRVIAGLPYTATLSPMYIEVVNAKQISFGKQKNPYKVHFRVNNSGTFNYGSSLDAMFPVSVREPDLTAGSPVPFFSGDPTTKAIESPSGTAPEFFITSDEPLPLELLSLTIFTKISEYQ